MALTQREAVIRALEARGEKRVEDRSLSKYVKYTRTYMAKRGPDGELIRSAYAGDYFHFIGKTGAVRVGVRSTGSVPMASANKAILVAEGRALK